MTKPLSDTPYAVELKACPVTQADNALVERIAAILEEWDMKPPPDETCGHAYSDIAADIIRRAQPPVQADNALVERLDKMLALDAPTASDHEWSELLAVVMDARNYIAALRTPAISSPIDAEEAEQCKRCGHKNAAWSAPSPLWNEVMRDGCINGEALFEDMVCAACFMVMAEEAGIASLFRVTAENVGVPLQTVTPTGRVWDDAFWCWVDPPKAEGEIERLRAMLVDDPNDVTAGVPEELIDAGMVVQDQANEDHRNYVAGETTDWDEGMLAAAIFKAMLRAALSSTEQEEGA